ncbi:MAG: hypothetical protein IKN04_05195 [Clostridia bacterium]|nr:hypothetical protein [Clostridia bacterium]
MAHRALTVPVMNIADPEGNLIETGSWNRPYKSKHEERSMTMREKALSL